MLGVDICIQFIAFWQVIFDRQYLLCVDLIQEISKLVICNRCTFLIGHNSLVSICQSSHQVDRNVLSSMVINVVLAWRIVYYFQSFLIVLVEVLILFQQRARSRTFHNVGKCDKTPLRNKTQSTCERIQLPLRVHQSAMLQKQDP